MPVPFVVIYFSKINFNTTFFKIYYFILDYIQLYWIITLFSV
jgi:hypothetical protein